MYTSGTGTHLQLLVISRNRLHDCCISFVWRERHDPNLGYTIPSKHEARLQKAHSSGIKNDIQHFVYLRGAVCLQNPYLRRAAVIVCEVLAQGVKDVTVVNV